MLDPSSSPSAVTVFKTDLQIAITTAKSRQRADCLGTLRFQDSRMLFLRPGSAELWSRRYQCRAMTRCGHVAELVGIEGGVVSGVFNLESSGVEAPDRRPRHEEHYHEALPRSLSLIRLCIFSTIGSTRLK